MKIPHKLELLWCRCFQGILKLGNYFMGYHMPEILEGLGTVRELGAFLKEKGINDVLVVTGSGMVRRGQVRPLLEGFERSGIRFSVQVYENTDPTTDDVELGYKTYREQGCKAIAAIGGGSRIDCAKAIAAKAVHPRKPAARLQGLLKVHWPVPPVVAIPTTAGAGSETTVAAVLTDSVTHRKASINDPFLIPKYAVLDPELTASMPPFTTATTGMDALAHAVEAYINKTYNTALEDQMARDAVKLIHDNILRVFENGEDLEARQNMQRGALWAGRAFTRGCVGYVHAIGHTLGGLYGVPHGLAMAVLLPKVMRAFGPAAQGRLAELAEVCGIGGGNEGEKAENFLRWMEQTNEKMGIPDGFPEIKTQDMDRMIAWARREAHPLYPVPVIWSEEDFRSFIESVRKTHEKDEK